jgi:hypothetical protein
LLLRCAIPAFEFMFELMAAPALPEKAGARTQARPGRGTVAATAQADPAATGRTNAALHSQRASSRRLQLRPILSIQCLTRQRIGCL